ncbi:MAG: DUF2344 domain-containing protein [Candidatus Gastranaerophilales bacterium]|nr:DUF2344 domain-containing protein [Candidatus Gastranaerophilales bacterium]
MQELQQNEQRQQVYSNTGYRYRLKISKTGNLKFISHLDWQKMLYHATRKAGLKINFSQGFNPAPKISIAIALPLFIEGKNEYVDIELQEEIADNIIKKKLNSVLPTESQISRIARLEGKKEGLQKQVKWAEYSATPEDELSLKKINIETIAKEFLLKENVIITKSSKKGKREKNIRASVHSLAFDREKNILMFILQVSDGSPRADEFLKALTPGLSWRITREKLLDSDFNEFIS